MEVIYPRFTSHLNEVLNIYANEFGYDITSYVGLENQ